jgi:hypothetical protein
MLDPANGLAPGDPARMAARIIDSVDMEPAPLPMLLGSQALGEHVRDVPCGAGPVRPRRIAGTRSYVTGPRRYVDRRIASPLRIGRPWKAPIREVPVMTIPIPTTATEHVIQPVPIRTRTLHGKPASAGRYAGTVRVIHSEAEFDRLRAGDVLVCRMFLPVWTVLFPVSVRWSPTPAESCPTRQSSPANAASPQSLLHTWAQLCCGTANWSSSMGRAGPWRSSDESAVGHRSAASPWI